MALWSAALFGHYKPKVDGWERRAGPGDFIAVRPFSEHGFWTPTERKEFLIVVIDDLDILQLSGLVEPMWDTDSYPVIPEHEIKRLRDKGERAELHPGRYIKKRRFHITLDDLRDKGVDIDRMLDKETIYSPDIDPLTKTRCFDKLNSRYARKVDGFNLLPPVLIGKVF
jgi:hypothetical protein